jgi:hypothetical protein
MKVHGLIIPQSAIDAGNAAMTGQFRAADISSAVSRALHDAEFDFGIQHKESVRIRIADRLIQKARTAGLIKFNAGTWRRA